MVVLGKGLGFSVQEASAMLSVKVPRKGSNTILIILLSVMARYVSVDRSLIHAGISLSGFRRLTIS